jgi:hypothetical protein
MLAERGSFFLTGGFDEKGKKLLNTTEILEKPKNEEEAPKWIEG